MLKAKCAEIPSRRLVPWCLNSSTSTSYNVGVDSQADHGYSVVIFQEYRPCNYILSTHHGLDKDTVPSYRRLHVGLCKCR